jgi:hypothetical protein
MQSVLFNRDSYSVHWRQQCLYEWTLYSSETAGHIQWGKGQHHPAHQWRTPGEKSASQLKKAIFIMDVIAECGNRISAAFLEECQLQRLILFGPQRSSLTVAFWLSQIALKSLCTILSWCTSISRSPDLDQVLSETAFNHPDHVRASYLSAPGWYDPLMLLDVTPVD